VQKNLTEGDFMLHSKMMEMLTISLLWR